MHFTDVNPVTDLQPTVVLLHSSGANARQWHGLASSLAATHRVIAPDFYGHGQSAPWLADRPMRLVDEVARIDALLADTPGPVHLVGHSYGASVALALALERPNVCTSLTLYEPVLFSVLLHYRSRASELQATIAVADSMRRHVALSRFDLAGERFVDFWAGEGSWAAMGPQRRQSIALRMPAVVAHFDMLFDAGITVGHLRTLRVPVRLLHGSATMPVARRVIELLRFALPRVESIELPGAGHMAPVTQPERVEPLVRAHLARFGDHGASGNAISSANSAAFSQAA